MTEELSTVLDPLSRVPGVRGALVVDAEAGIPVVGELTEGVSGRAVAALAASLFRRTGRGVDSAGFGAVRTLQLGASAGHLVMADAGALLVVAVGEPDAQVGRLRVEVQRVAEGLA